MYRWLNRHSMPNHGKGIRDDHASFLVLGGSAEVLCMSTICTTSGYCVALSHEAMHSFCFRAQISCFEGRRVKRSDLPIDPSSRG